MVEKPKNATKSSIDERKKAMKGRGESENTTLDLLEIRARGWEATRG